MLLFTKWWVCKSEENEEARRLLFNPEEPSICHGGAGGGGFFHSKGTWGCAARKGMLFPGAHIMGGERGETPLPNNFGYSVPKHWNSVPRISEPCFKLLSRPQLSKQPYSKGNFHFSGRNIDRNNYFLENSDRGRVKLSFNSKNIFSSTTGPNKASQKWWLVS